LTLINHAAQAHTGAMTGKTRNNNLIPLPGVFALAKKDHASRYKPLPIYAE